MRNSRAFLALVVTLVCCAGHTGGFSQEDTRRPRWQQGMDQARHNAAAGMTFDLALTSPGPTPSGAVYVFYNNPTPFCYMYAIPGNWKHAGSGFYRSTDGRAGAGVLFKTARSLENVAGTTLVERARTDLISSLAKDLNQRLTDVRLVPFDATRPGTWKLSIPPMKQGERRIILPTRILVDLSPDAIAHVTVGGTGDDDGLARRIIETLRITSTPECYWSVLENMLKSLHGEQ